MALMNSSCPQSLGYYLNSPPDARAELLAQALGVMDTIPTSGLVPAMVVKGGAGAKGCFLSEPTPSSLWMQMAM